MIELKNISRSYDYTLAVDDLSLKISKGEIVGFLGPNGAGKSTTMKIISGFIFPDEGSVLIDGKDIKENLVDIKAKIGYMPENNPLYKEMLVKEAIQYALDLHQIPKERRKERIDYVVKATGIENVYYRPISELSKGYKQRVGLAQVLAHDPEILILDEPTEGLDPNQRAEVRDLIKKFGKDRTVIISTHVMQEVEAMCNRIVIINKGKVIADGNKDEILKAKGGNTVLDLKIKTGSKVVKKDFTDIKVDEVTIEKIDGMYEIQLVSNSGKLFENLTQLIKSRDWVIYELRERSENLEDVFRELTK